MFLTFSCVLVILGAYGHPPLEAINDTEEEFMFFGLPESVAAYFRADKGDVEAFAKCFTDVAVVKDEGHTYIGIDEIRRWKAEAASKYTYTSEPFASEERDQKIVVTSRLTGDFPGSPIDLRFFFEIAHDKIASLEIVP
jgi:hypothetical protein